MRISPCCPEVGKLQPDYPWHPSWSGVASVRALFQLRWGKGWICPACGHGGYAELKGRAVCQCNRCKRQVGLTAGTVFHWTKLPLTIWFLAISHLTQSKGGMSSVLEICSLRQRRSHLVSVTPQRRHEPRTWRNRGDGHFSRITPYPAIVSWRARSGQDIHCMAA
jgi:hypothetical protein